jgi:phosphate/sulfate permease
MYRKIIVKSIVAGALGVLVGAFVVPASVQRTIAEKLTATTEVRQDTAALHPVVTSDAVAFAAILTQYVEAMVELKRQASASANPPKPTPKRNVP